MGELGAVVLCLVLAAGMLVLLEAGFRLARRFETTRGGEETGIFDTAIFALLGLLLGFAFSGAVDRLTARRDLIVQEANAIGTAYLRVDLLPVEQQPDMRVLFRDYVSERLKLYGVIDAGGNAQAQFQRIGSIQHAIWDGAVAGVLQPERQFAAEVVLPAINDMIDITSTRRVALGTYLPELVLGLLVGVSLLSALLAGAGMARHGRRFVLHGGIFAAAVSLTVYTILDLDNPRGGLIRMDAAEHALIALRDTM